MGARLTDEDVFGAVQQVQAAKQKFQDQDIWGQIKGAAETVLSVGTGAVATPVAGIAGAAVTALKGPEAGVAVVQNIQQEYTYQPRTEAGQAVAEGLGAAGEPVSKALKVGAENLGMKAQKLTDSEVFGGVVASTAQAIPNLIGQRMPKPVVTKAAEVRDAARARWTQDVKRYFNEEALNQAMKQNSGSREIVVYMSPKTFLSLAEEGFDRKKMERTSGLMAEGKQFSDIPYLHVKSEGDVLQAIGHEGRHRARALLDAGVNVMPVVIKSDDIRWGYQNRPDQKFDYRPVFPTKIRSEEKHGRKLMLEAGEDPTGLFREPAVLDMNFGRDVYDLPPEQRVIGEIND